MLRKVTLLLSFLIVFLTHTNAQNNIADVDGPLSVCVNVPVKYRVIFNNTCANPNVVDIRKYNQNEGGGDLISHTFLGSGTLPDGRLYQDFNLTFNVNFGLFPGGAPIGIVFQSVCNADNNTGQLKGLTISITPPPVVEISSASNNIFTRHLVPGGGAQGHRVFTSFVSTATGNTTYKWIVTGNLFSVSGADDQYSVDIKSTAAVSTSGTLMLQTGLSGCGTMSATVDIKAVPVDLVPQGLIAAVKEPSKDSAQLVIYGNPTTDNLVARITNNSTDKLDLLIYDANKRVVKIYRGYTNSATINVDVSSLSNGVYFLNLVSPGSTLSLTKKFVIQR
jgi:hypothetical protein